MIKVNYRALGMLSTNCYVVENPDSQKVLIVDPGDSPLEIERQIDEIDGDPEAILLTHGHFDHMLAADALRKKYHIPVYVHEKEQHLLGDPKENLSGLWSKPYTMQADKTVKEQHRLPCQDGYPWRFRSPSWQHLRFRRNHRKYRLQYSKWSRTAASEAAARTG